jgi:hypothetical protein
MVVTRGRISVLRWPLAVAAAVVFAAGAPTEPGGAIELAPAGSAFRVEWNVPPLPPSRAKLEGYVYNDSLYRVTNVRLRVVALDGSGDAEGETWGWVFGDVPAGGRAYFALPLSKPAATYRVTVNSFDVVSGGAP